jgi:hypothetical protein
MPVPVYGTSPADHLAYEVTERLQASGYASRAGAERAWIRACRDANDRRVAQGMSRVSRPACEVVLVGPWAVAQCGDTGPERYPTREEAERVAARLNADAGDDVIGDGAASVVDMAEDARS